MLQLQAQATGVRRHAKRCIIIYCWGGISHMESWDPKPEALADLRGEFSAIQTATAGIRYCEHIPLMAQHSDKLAIVRSIYHSPRRTSTGDVHEHHRTRPPRGRESQEQRQLALFSSNDLSVSGPPRRDAQRYPSAL